MSIRSRLKGRDSHGGPACHAGKGGGWSGRYRTSVCAFPLATPPPALAIERNRITEEDIEGYMMANLAGSLPLDILARYGYGFVRNARNVVGLMSYFSAGV